MNTGGRELIIAAAGALCAARPIGNTPRNCAKYWPCEQHGVTLKYPMELPVVIKTGVVNVLSALPLILRPVSAIMRGAGVWTRAAEPVYHSWMPFTRRDWLRLSDERDTWLERVIEAEEEGYEHGLLDGWVQGYEQARREMDQEWRRVARQASLARPSHAELDKKRYPPSGREGWIAPG